MVTIAAKIELEVQGIDEVQTMINLINDHRHSLPKKLIDSLEELSDCDKCEMDHEYWSRTFGGEFTCEPHIDQVQSINTILKRVTFGVIDGNGDLRINKDLGCVVLGQKKLDHFKVYSDGKLVIEW